MQLPNFAQFLIYGIEDIGRFLLCYQVELATSGMFPFSEDPGGPSSSDKVQPRPGRVGVRPRHVLPPDLRVSRVTESF